MISSFTLKNFKSFEDATLLIEEFTTLIGPNNAGKTNVFEGVQVLVGIISGKKVSDVLEKYVRGGTKKAARIGTDSFTLGCSVFYKENSKIYYEVTVNCINEPVIERESLTFNDQEGKRVIFSNSTIQSENQVHEVSSASNVVVFKKHMNNYPIDYSYEAHATFSQINIIRNHFLHDLSKSKDLEYVDTILSNLLGINFVNLDNNLIYNYSNMSDHNYNFVLTLKNICEDPRQKQLLFKYIQDICENPILDFEFTLIDNDQLSFMLKEKYGETNILMNPSELSHGIIRYIIIITALLYCKENSMLLIDNFDQGIYPNNVVKLIQILHQIAREKHIDIIVSTHNAALLNQYNNEEKSGVSVVYRLNDRRISTIVSLLDLDDFLRIVTHGNGLGSSVMDNYLMKRLKEEKIEKELDLSWSFNE